MLSGNVAHGCFNPHLRVDRPFPPPETLIGRGEKRVCGSFEFLWGQITGGASVIFAKARVSRHRKVSRGRKDFHRLLGLGLGTCPQA